MLSDAGNIHGEEDGCKLLHKQKFVKLQYRMPGTGEADDDSGWPTNANPKNKERY